MDNTQWVAGVDEAGRGPLAGPVVAAAVILPANHGIIGITDSKKLTAKRRDELYEAIREGCIAFAIGQADVAEIEQLNIFHANLLAMQRAVMALTTIPDEVVVDGKHCPKVPMPVKAIVRGDQTVTVIGAASILAKVTRDRIMIDYDQQYPGYGFATHKGYGTKQHFLQLQKLGLSPIHRRSFLLRNP